MKKSFLLQQQTRILQILLELREGWLLIKCFQCSYSVCVCGPRSCFVIATVEAQSSSHRLLLNLYPDWRVRLKLLFSFSWPSSVSTALQQWEVGGGAEEGPPFALKSLRWLLHLQANLLVCLFVSFSNSARHQLVFKHFRQFLLLPAFLLTSHSSSSASAFPSTLIPSSLPQSSPPVIQLWLLPSAFSFGWTCWTPCCCFCTQTISLVHQRSAPSSPDFI